MSPKKITSKKTAARSRATSRKKATSGVTKRMASPPAKAPETPDSAAPDAAQGHSETELLEFVQAIDDYKRNAGRPFPNWSEVLDVFKELGYRRSA